MTRSGSSKRGIVLGGSGAIAALVTLGGYDKAQDILAEMVDMKTAQVALAGEVSKLSATVELKIDSGDARAGVLQSKVEDHETRLRLIESAIAAQVAAAAATSGK